MIRGVVFDFDGVLANSEPLHFRGFRDVLAAHGITLTEQAYYHRYLGYDDVGAFRAIASDQGRHVDDGEITQWVAHKATRIEELERGISVLFPGARETVERMARRGPVAIASGALRHEIVRILEREQLTKYFPVLVAAEDTSASKPDPAPYALAVNRLKLQPHDCVAIEDSHWGLVSAKRAGLRTIGITHSYSASDLTEADLVIDRLDEMTDQLLQKLA